MIRDMGRIMAGKVSDIPPGKMQKVKIDGKELVLTNIEGEFFAVDDACTHSGASLSEGKIEGNIITCGWHSAQFDCKTGKLLKFPAKIRNLQSYQVIVEGQDLFVESL